MYVIAEYITFIDLSDRQQAYFLKKGIKGYSKIAVYLFMEPAMVNTNAHPKKEKVG